MDAITRQKLRESTYYPLVEILGLLVSAHVAICLVTVLLQYVVYAKALSNMAKRFNARLVYKLGNSYSVDPNFGKVSIVQRYIPYQKLYAEHMIILSLFHHFGQVNAVTFLWFLFTMALEVMLTVWMLFEIFVEKPLYSRTYFVKKGDVSVAVPLRIVGRQIEDLIEFIILGQITLFGFAMFGNAMYKAADALHIGNEYCRRHGLMLCKSTMERRFILSLYTSFTTNKPYWIGRVFNYNRSFIIGFVGFVVGTSMVFASFHPSRTAVTSIESCDVVGSCTVYRLPKNGLGVIYQAVQVSDDDKHEQGFLIGPPTPARTKSPIGVVLQHEVDAFIHPPCLSAGAYLHNSYTEACPSNWNDASFPFAIFTPVMYKPYMLTASDGTTTMTYYRLVPVQFATFPAASMDCNGLSLIHGYTHLQGLEYKTAHCASSEFPCHYFPFIDYFSHTHSIEVVDCFGTPVLSQEVDDCRNYKLSIVNSALQKQDPIMRVINSADIPGASQQSLLCCYEYVGYDNSEGQAKVCNMPDAETFNQVCMFGTNRRPRKGNNILEHYQRLFSRVEYEKNINNNPQYLTDNQDIFKKCLCALGDSTPTQSDSDKCTIKYLPPCIPGYETGKASHFTLECKPTATGVTVYIPFLFKLKSDFSEATPVEHKRFLDHCTGPKFTDPFFHDDALTYPNGVKGDKGDTLELSDCSGNKITLTSGDRDDCLNWRVMTPAANNDGQMTTPSVQLLGFDYDKRVKKFVAVSTSTTDEIFLCCFNYANKVFQNNPDQLKYCKAPSVDAMNAVGWCNGAAIRGYTTPPNSGISSDTPKLHEKLYSKFQLTSAYHDKQNTGEGVGNMWTQCLCPNLMTPSFSKLDYEKVMKNCIASIPTPCELDSVGLYQAYPVCSHQWSGWTDKLLTPRIFTLDNGIWENTDRFQMSGNPKLTDKCLKNSDWEERYGKNDGSSTELFDCFLEKIPKGEMDDCGNLPTPTGNGDTSSRKLPTKRIVVEDTLKQYEASFANSKKAHCCYSYPGFTVEQWKVCNMPDPQSITKKCSGSTGRAPVRVKHEHELVRRLRIAQNGGNFVGSKVSVNKGALDWDTVEEKTWRECICEGKSDAKCEKLYLPPCIDISGSSYIEVANTYTTCHATWGSGSPASLSVPIAMQFDNSDKSFQKLKRFKEGTTEKECPSDKTTDILTSGSGSSIAIITYCYGESFTSGKVDECQNPYIATPNRRNLQGMQYPQLVLIPLNGINEFSTSDEFYCCYQYAISDKSEVGVCNQPNKEALTKQCSDSKRPAFVKPFVADLKSKRTQQPPDILQLPFTDPLRVGWTKCICEADNAACQSVKTPVINPTDCMKIPEAMYEKKMFTQCKNTEKTSTPSWMESADFLRYPTILYKNPTTAKFSQVMPLGSDCVSQPPLLSVASTVPSGVGILHDCLRKTYNYESKPGVIPKAPGYFVDECGNPYLPSDTPDFWTLKGTNHVVLRAVYKNAIKDVRDARLYCCFEYNWGKGFNNFNDPSYKQAQYCNMPNQATFTKKCGSTYKRVGPRAIGFATRAANEIDTRIKYTPEVVYDYTVNPLVTFCVCDFLDIVKSHPMINEYQKKCADCFDFGNC